MTHLCRTPLMAALLVLASLAPLAHAQNAPASGPAAGEKTRAEIDAIIEKAGSTKPDWWDSVKLTYPPTLDLTWQTPPKGAGWQQNKYLGQYFWSVVDEQPAMWKSGIKLLDHVMEVNKDDPAKLKRTMLELGRCYAHYTGDWARGAYWLRKSGDGNAAVGLAECYYRLGARQLAVETLAPRAALHQAPRLLAQMGEIDKALEGAAAIARQSAPHGYFVAGDVCRAALRFDDAIGWYQKAIVAARSDRRASKFAERAASSLEGVKAMQKLDVSKLADGAYSGSAIGYVNDVEVIVNVKGGKIVSAKVDFHEEDGYFYHQCDPRLLNDIVAAQGPKGVDTITGATVTAEAIINATAKALAGQKK